MKCKIISSSTVLLCVLLDNKVNQNKTVNKIITKNRKEK